LRVPLGLLTAVAAYGVANIFEESKPMPATPIWIELHAHRGDAAGHGLVDEPNPGHFESVCGGDEVLGIPIKFRQRQGIGGQGQ